MRLQTEFIEKQLTVSPEVYDNMLGAVPPIRMVSNAFLVGECYDHVPMVQNDGTSILKPRYALYYTEGGKHYHGGLTTLKGFDMFVVPEGCNLACQLSDGHDGECLTQ